jgi:hypothetical protein
MSRSDLEGGKDPSSHTIGGTGGVCPAVRTPNSHEGEFCETLFAAFDVGPRSGCGGFAEAEVLALDDLPVLVKSLERLLPDRLHVAKEAGALHLPVIGELPGLKVGQKVGEVVTWSE